MIRKRQPAGPSAPAAGCRLWRLVCAVTVAGLLLGGPAAAGAFAAGAAQPAPDEAHAEQAEAHGAAEEHAAEEAHEESIWATIARLVNFAILAGVLVYFLRSPLVTHLRDRSEQVRSDLAAAATTQAEAARQLEEIDRKLQALPAELDTLRARGAEEVAAEEARIREASERERQRVLKQTRREIDLQLRAARQELVREAATLATGVAAERIRRSITDADQIRLVDRYLDDIRGS